MECVLWRKTARGAVFCEAEMVQLCFGFGITFLSKVHPVFCHTGNAVFLKVVIATNIFSILKMLLFIQNIFSEMLLCTKCQNVLTSYGKQKKSAS